jgi:curved DNA-binding protein CbpA
MKDYYEVLGVSRNASAAQIKRAYRRLIKRCHPDVNSSPRAAERTVELNEAYGVLADTQARMSYDLDLKAGESAWRESRPKPAGASEGRGAGQAPPESEEPFCCQWCGVVDASLRVSATWRVLSFIYSSNKTPTTQILCGRCRVKESLRASAYTVCFGWWSVPGVVWTMKALWSNACGGGQPKESNAALLNALGSQLSQAGRSQEAYEAVLAAFRLNPDPTTQEALERLRQNAGVALRKPFWKEFCGLELHPLCYHVPLGAALVVLVVWLTAW